MHYILVCSAVSLDPFIFFIRQFLQFKPLPQRTLDVTMCHHVLPSDVFDNIDNWYNYITECNFTPNEVKLPKA